MQDKYYSTPLHGVECFLTNTPCSNSLANSSFASSPTKNSISSSELALNLAFQDVSVGEQQPIWTLKDQGLRYLTELNLYPHIDSTTKTKPTSKSYALSVNCEGKGRFLVQQNKITIDWDQGTSSSHYFQTLALALWLEMKHVPCIHGNALKYKQQAFALVAPSGTGKSTLSAKLKNLGCDWLTDDMMAMHHCSASKELHRRASVYPSWPIARMWPDSVENALGGDKMELAKVHDRFEKRQIELPELPEKSKYSSELSVIYVLNRTVTDNTDNSLCCAIETINSSQALILLLQNSMLGNAYSALQLETDRVRQLSNLVQSTIVKKITYASGKANLDAVSKAILKDLEK